jgi:hypothetical protein
MPFNFNCGQVPISRLLGNWEFLPPTGLNLRQASQLAQKPQFRSLFKSLIWRVPFSKFCLPKNRCLWANSFHSTSYPLQLASCCTKADQIAGIRKEFVKRDPTGANSRKEKDCA